MKKLLIVLMVIAMASFLFTGCIPTAPEVPEVPEVPVVPATDAPIITGIAGVAAYDLTTTATTRYINIADAAAGITVSGVGPVNSIIKIYVNNVWAGTGSTGWTGTFSATISAAGLGTTDGSKALSATATQSGLAESVASTAYTFMQDTARPTITSVLGSNILNYITVTFNEAVVGTTVVAATWSYSAPAVNPPATIVVTITVPSSTVARLYETVGDPLLVSDITLSVSCSAAVTDLAGNVITAVVVYGFTY